MTSLKQTQNPKSSNFVLDIIESTIGFVRMVDHRIWILKMVGHMWTIWETDRQSVNTNGLGFDTYSRWGGEKKRLVAFKLWAGYGREWSRHHLISKDDVPVCGHDMSMLWICHLIVSTTNLFIKLAVLLLRILVDPCPIYFLYFFFLLSSSSSHDKKK